MEKVIIHIDMDAFYAAVEVRDDPDLVGKPLIIGALPHERGVVSTCSYEARKYGVHSAMSIKEAHRLCPEGIYMHPNPEKYKKASDQIHKIWSDYTDLVEYISLDEGYLDVTGTAHSFGGAKNIGHGIKSRVKNETGLSCSVGIGYSMMSAKLASEEKKPDGFFEIPTPETLKNLIIDRNVRIIYGIGQKTAEILQKAGIHTVRDIYEDRQKVIRLLGNHGHKILELADGTDNREVTPYTEPKSIGKEHTFQQDITDFDYLKDVLLLIARELSFDIRQKEIYCRTITLKITFGNMRAITRSKSGEATNRTEEIYHTAAKMLDKIEKRPVRLVGISLSSFTKSAVHQMSFEDIGVSDRKEKLENMKFELQQKYGGDIVKTGSELEAEKRFKSDRRY